MSKRIIPFNRLADYHLVDSKFRLSLSVSFLSGHTATHRHCPTRVKLITQSLFLHGLIHRHTIDRSIHTHTQRWKIKKEKFKNGPTRDNIPHLFSFGLLSNCRWRISFICYFLLSSSSSSSSFSTFFGTSRMNARAESVFARKRV